MLFQLFEFVFGLGCENGSGCLNCYVSLCWFRFFFGLFYVCSVLSPVPLYFGCCLLFQAGVGCFGLWFGCFTLLVSVLVCCRFLEVLSVCSSFSMNFMLFSGCCIVLWFDATFSKASGFFALDRTDRMFVNKVSYKAVNCQPQKHFTMRLCTSKEEL